MSSSSELWTIGQLTEQVAAALQRGSDVVDSAERGIGQAASVRTDRRVREVPDVRTVRWYQTTGLVDRPVAVRGRTALYGRRHLLQLLAIKRLQAEGRSLAEIQAELAGAPETSLATLASEVTAEVSAADSAAEPRDHRFWADVPSPASTTGSSAGHLEAMARHEPDWTSLAIAGVRVDEALTVLVEGLTRPLDAADVEALRRAARPVVEALRRRGLVTPRPRPHPPSIPKEYT